MIPSTTPVPASDVPTIENFGPDTVSLRHRLGRSRFEPLHEFSLLGWGSEDTTIRLLHRRVDAQEVRIEERDALSASMVRAFALEPGPPVRGIGLSASRALISAANPSRLELWDLDRAEPVDRVELDLSNVDDLAVSADARWAVLHSYEGVTLVSLSERRIVVTVPGRSPIAVSEDGERFLAHAPLNGLLNVYRRDGTLIESLEAREDIAIWSAVFTRDGRAVVAGLSYGSFLCWVIALGKTLWRQSHPDADVIEIARSPDGETFFFLNDRSEVCAVTALGASRWTWSPPRPQRVARGPRKRLVLSSNGAMLAVGGYDRFRVLDASTGVECSWTSESEVPVACLALSPTGTLVASGSTAGEVRVYDLTDGDKLWTLELDGAAPTSIEFLPDRPALRTCDEGRTVRQWNLRTGFEEGRWSFEGEGPVAAWGSLDGSRVLIQHGSRLELWSDLGAERVRWSIELPGPGVVTFAAFNGPDVVVCVPNVDLPGWDVNTLDAEAGWVLGTRFLSTRPLALQETPAGPISLTNVPDRTELRCVLTEEWGRRQTGTIAARFEAARVSTDGRWLVGNNRRDVEVWSLGSPPARVARITLNVGATVTSLAISADGTTFAVGTQGGELLAFSLVPSR